MKKITTSEHQAYMPASQGPFRCDHCEYYPTAGQCNNTKVIGWAKKGLYGLSIAGENAKVDPAGCSDEFKKR